MARINQHPHSKKCWAILLWVGPSLLINMCDTPFKKTLRNLNCVVVRIYWFLIGFRELFKNIQKVISWRNVPCPISPSHPIGRQVCFFKCMTNQSFLIGGLLPSSGGFINTNFANQHPRLRNCLSPARPTAALERVRYMMSHVSVVIRPYEQNWRS